MLTKRILLLCQQKVFFLIKIILFAFIIIIGKRQQQAKIRQTTMWSTTKTGKVLWSAEAKLLLVKQIDQNIHFLGKSKDSQQALEIIYSNLVKKGMPEIGHQLLRKVWTKLRLTIINRNQEDKRHGNVRSMRYCAEAVAAVIEVINKANKLFGTDVRIY